MSTYELLEKLNSYTPANELMHAAAQEICNLRSMLADVAGRLNKERADIEHYLWPDSGMAVLK